MKLSEKGWTFIKSYEKLRLRSYDAGDGLNTIGWGHVMSSSEFSHIVQPISPKLADEFFLRDIEKAEGPLMEDFVIRDVRLLRQHEWDALVSFIFNVGRGAFRTSTLRRLLIEGHEDDAANQFARWNKSRGKVMKGLTLRREAERNIFVNRVYVDHA